MCQAEAIACGHSSGSKENTKSVRASEKCVPIGLAKNKALETVKKELGSI